MVKKYKILKHNLQIHSSSCSAFKNNLKEFRLKNTEALHYRTNLNPYSKEPKR